MNKCAILIPNYNGAGFISATVNQFLEGFQDFTVVVVDDGSTDNSLQLLIETNCILLERRKNGGFAAAVNTGLKYLIENEFDYVIVANSDLIVDTLVAEKIRDSIHMFNVNLNVGILGYCEFGESQCAANVDISGFLFAVRLGIIKQIGYMDESFIMYGEEQDFFRRVITSGFEIYQTKIHVQHATEGSGGKSLRSSWLSIRNAIYLEAKQHFWWQSLRVCCTLFLILNRLYYPKGYNRNPSYQRVVRPGIILGNIFLLSAVIWNIKKSIQNL